MNLPSHPSIAEVSRYPNFKPSRPPRGFTLVEMLVVIVIIITLAALAFFFTGRAKESALKAREMTNMRSIAALVITYSTDKGILPGKPSSGAVGGLNRGVVVPSRSTVAAENSLSTYLIVNGYIGSPDGYKSGADDDMWLTTGTRDNKSNSVSMVINSGTSSTPDNFFGRKQGTDADPLPLAALKRNRDEVEPPDGVSFGLEKIWMICTADEENYATGGSVSSGVSGNSKWGGRFYAFFDGHVDFVKRQTPSIYPSSYNDYK